MISIHELKAKFQDPGILSQKISASQISMSSTAKDNALNAPGQDDDKNLQSTINEGRTTE
jgi:hypothetical protein